MSKQTKSDTPFDESKQAKSDMPFDESKQAKSDMPFDESKQAKSDMPFDESKQAKSDMPFDESKQAKSGMPFDESKLSFEIPRTDTPREKIIKLGKMITDRIPAKLKGVTGNDPEYWGLAGVVTDEMADIALKMGVRKPKTLPELVKLTGKDETYLEKILYDMAYIGLIEYNWDNLNHEKQYVLPRFVLGSAEFFNMQKPQIDEHPEVAAFFERMTFMPLEKITPMVPPGGAGIGMHVIPVEKAIETENQSVSVEHISHWLKKYEGKYAKSMCACRASRAKLGEGCGDDPESWCIAVGDMADYVVETDRGKYITYDEVLDILRQAEDNGFVHQITNIDGENKIFPYAIVMLMSAMPCALHNFLTLLT